MGREKMAEIEQQVIAYCNLKEPLSKITIVFGDNWAYKIERIWGKKKVDRYLLNIMDNGEAKTLECSPSLYEEIVKNTETVRKRNLYGVDLIIKKDLQGYNVEVVKKGFINRIRNWFKK